MAISVMLKPASSSCNLKCEYCFYNSLSSERKDFSKGMMNSDTAKRIIVSALEFARGSDVYFTFQGGEPLLAGKKFFADFVEYAKENNSLNSEIHYCLQTNGTLIDDDFADFIKANGFLVGVSLDGTSEHNKYRVYPNGKSSFEDVMRGINILKSKGAAFNVLSVLTKHTAENFRSAYRFFKENDLRYLQFIICLKPFKSDYDSSLYMTEKDYENYLNTAFKIYFNGYMRGDYVSIRSFDNYIALSNGGNAEQCGMNGCCSAQFVVEGDGSTYPCDFYCIDEWYLGNINKTGFDEMYHSQRAAEFLKQSFIVDERCRECEYFTICRGGGCKRNRIDSDYCPSYKSFFESNMFRIKQMKG